LAEPLKRLLAFSDLLADRAEHSADSRRLEWGDLKQTLEAALF
jgi:hypothetical protein